MKIFLRIFCLGCMINILPVYGKAIDVLSISFPFQNIPLSPNVSFRVNYSFRDSSGNTHPLIFCYQSNGGNVRLTWPYKGISHSASMPLTLTTDSKYTGSFADFNGALTVSNSSNVQLLVSCLYAF